MLERTLMFPILVWSLVIMRRDPVEAKKAWHLNRLLASEDLFFKPLAIRRHELQINESNVNLIETNLRCTLQQRSERRTKYIM